MFVIQDGIWDPGFPYVGLSIEGEMAKEEKRNASIDLGKHVTSSQCRSLLVSSADAYTCKAEHL